MNVSPINRHITSKQQKSSTICFCEIYLHGCFPLRPKISLPHMKELSLFRIFALFPFIGMVIPDLASALNSSFSAIKPEHVIVDVTLSVCLIICSAGIWVLEARQTGKNPLKPGEDTGTSVLGNFYLND